VCNRDGERTRERGSASDTAREQETFGSERGREAEVESRETSILYLGTFVHAIARAYQPCSLNLLKPRRCVTLPHATRMGRDWSCTTQNAAPYVG